MLELSIALIISAVAAVFAIKMQVQASKLSFASIQGDNMLVAHAASAAYLAEFYAELQGNLPITKETPTGPVTIPAGTGVGQIYKPTFAQLKSMGYLTASFSEQSSFSNGPAPGSYQIQISRVPVGCELVAVNSCDIEGYLFADKAITASGSTDPDGPAIAAIVGPLGGFGGFSMNANSGTIYGNGGGWTWPNPLPGNPAGVVVAKFGFNSAGLRQFVRMNDTRDPNLQNTLTVAKGITADSYVTPIKNVGDTCTVPNAIASGSAAGLICIGTTWQSLGDRAAPGTACAPDGKVATSTTTGEQLICKNGVYIKSTSLLSKNILVSRATVQDGDVVPKPTCDTGGVPDRSFSLTRIATDVSVAPPKQSMYASTDDLGGSWRIVIRLRTDVGSESSGNSYNVTAVLNLECKY